MNQGFGQQLLPLLNVRVCPGFFSFLPLPLLSSVLSRIQYSPIFSPGPSVLLPPLFCLARSLPLHFG